MRQPATLPVTVSKNLQANVTESNLGNICHILGIEIGKTEVEYKWRTFGSTFDG